MFSEIEPEDKTHRSNFYTGGGKQDSYDWLKNIVSVIYPQQINIGDKTSGKLIAQDKEI